MVGRRRKEISIESAAFTHAEVMQFILHSLAAESRLNFLMEAHNYS